MVSLHEKFFLFQNFQLRLKILTQFQNPEKEKKNITLRPF